MGKLLMHSCYNIVLTDIGIGYLSIFHINISLCSLFALKKIHFFVKFGCKDFFLKILQGRSDFQGVEEKQIVM